MKGPHGPQTQVHEGAYAIKVSMKISLRWIVVYIASELSARTISLTVCVWKAEEAPSYLPSRLACVSSTWRGYQKNFSVSCVACSPKLKVSLSHLLTLMQNLVL